MISRKYDAMKEELTGTDVKMWLGLTKFRERNREEVVGRRGVIFNEERERDLGNISINLINSRIIKKKGRSSVSILLSRRGSSISLAGREHTNSLKVTRGRGEEKNYNEPDIIETIFGSFP